METDRRLDQALPGASLRVYEVFRQEADGAPMVHAGQVEAPDDELAPRYARDAYARRGESVRLWVVPRTAILELTDPDLLEPELDRSYRSGKAYRVAVEKRRALRERLGTLKGGPDAPPEHEEHAL